MLAMEALRTLEKGSGGLFLSIGLNTSHCESSSHYIEGDRV